jgi:predicted NUDIX family NTP pyrophosphohydrolase
LASSRTSAGVLLYRLTGGRRLEVLLAHPGGPYWAKKDEGAWTIPKGEILADEDPLAGALREFKEETGVALKGEAIDLGMVRQAAGKRVHGFALEGDVNPGALISNAFDMEWPPKSGKRQSFPEIDRAAWFSPEVARRKINPAQTTFIDALQHRLGLIDA